MLDANYLIADDDDITDVWNLSYVQDEYVTMLRRQVLSNYYDFYEADLEASIDADYVAERYNEILQQQTANYDSSSDNFESAMGSLSDTSFVLYAPEVKGSENKFGYVYNILLPFSSAQSTLLSTYSTLLENDAIDQNGYYQMRNNLLAGIQGTDQRSAWFNGALITASTLKRAASIITTAVRATATYFSLKITLWIPTMKGMSHSINTQVSILTTQSRKEQRRQLYASSQLHQH